ncbi:MAG: class I SAM-dependent methyltransferase, partial [Pseudomonadota bacterium]
GCSYTATEIDAELVERASAAGFDARMAPEDLSTEFGDLRFDAILCFDVLEHLTQEQITAMLTQFRAVLSETGRVLARFPSGDSPFSVAMYNGDITHRSWIGRGAVLQYCVATGMQAEQIRHPVLPLTGVGVKRMLRRAPIAVVRWVTRKFVRMFFYDGQPRVVDPNMVIVLSRA